MTGGSLLDGVLPEWQFAERHETTVEAPAEAAMAAVRAVTAREILFFRTLTAIRRGFRRGPESILHAPADQPILDVATRTTFRLLAEDGGREVVVGTFVLAPRGCAGPPATADAFRAATGPGYARAAMNFAVQALPGGRSRVVTETRVFATDPRSRRRFRRYWLLIRPWSGLLRRTWLRAIRRRAEGATSRR